MEDPELKAKLAQLDHELEEGDITTKGYQKRRTMILSQYLGPQVAGGIMLGGDGSSSDPSGNSPHSGMSPYSRPSAPLAALDIQQPMHQRQDTMSSLNSTPYGGIQYDYGQQGGVGIAVSGSSGGSGAPGGVPYNPAIAHIRSESNASHLSPHSRHTSMTFPAMASHSRNPSGTSARSSSYAYSPQQQPAGGYQYDYYSNNNNNNNNSSLATSHHSSSSLSKGYGPDAGRYGSQDMGDTARGDGVYDPATGYFTDFTTHGFDPVREPSGQFGPRPLSNFSISNPTQMPNRYPGGDGVPFSPTAAMAPPMLTASDMPPPSALNHLLPLEPRDPDPDVRDTHNGEMSMKKFDNIASVLRHRARTNPKLGAYMVVDSKGREFATCTWEKLASRAEKVAQVIRDKSNLYRGDRVALLYRDVEVIDFAVALLGCFIAGVVAVPINALEDYTKLNFILTNTQAHLALTTDYNLKAFQRDLVAQKLAWPRGVEWWKTNEFGAYNPKKKDDVPPLQVPDLAYIEFSKAPTGDLRGVVMSHRTIMHQMNTLSAIINSAQTTEKKDTFSTALKDKAGNKIAGGSSGEILVSYLDPRQQIGLIMGVLLNVFGGHTTVLCHPTTVVTPGLYAHFITRYKATLVLADYPGLKTVAYNYQQDPWATRNFAKKTPVDFSNVKLCFIDSLTVDPEFHEILADRWLRPLGNPRARDIVAPMLCLPEHGGMVITMRDWLGGEERMGCPLKLEPVTEEKESDEESDSDADSEDGKDDKGKTKEGSVGFSSSLIGGSSVTETQPDKTSELGEVLLDKEALKTNDVCVVAMGNEARKRAGDQGVIRIGAFGFPIPDATLAIVDPETMLLCTPNVIGEIWVDSPSLSGGFWALPKHTEAIFHARPYRFDAGSPTPIAVEQEFLRTGLLGCVIEGKIYVLGLYEDRLRQKVEWVEDVAGSAEGPPEYRYYFVQHLIISILRKVPKIFDSSAFDCLVNNEHLPIILLESHAASTSPQAAGGPPRQLDTALLDSLSERCMEVLLEEHHLRVYCVMITAPNTLPRVWKNGRKEIGNILCRKEFDIGALPCVHVKFGVERAVLNLPVGIDPEGGIWSQIATQNRQEMLMGQEKQYSGFDYREVVIDDRTATPLNQFTSIVDLLQWRVMRQAEELSYCTIDFKGKEGKMVTWKKLDTKIAAVASVIKNKWKLQAGDHVILMYTHSEDYVYAVHACFCLGIIAIPAAPLDQNRLMEDCPALLHMIKDFDVKTILVNNEVDHLFKVKTVMHHLKQLSTIYKIPLPPLHNTTKPPKTNIGCRDLKLTMDPRWVDPNYTALVWTYWTPDQRRIAVSLSHETIMGMCKVQKETCQMTSSKPVLGCVRSTSGLGFIHTCLMGVFVGAPTYIVSPLDFAQNPLSLFLTMSRYKVKDTYATPQMLDHAIGIMSAKGFTLHELKNMMISCEGRPRTDIFQRVRLHFAAVGLDRTAINTIYSHVLNPMIASRSYMCIEPIELWLDPKALRSGLVYQVDPEANPGALLVQDSGMVPVSTQVAIVNPETNCLCHTGEYGEIWVESEACVRSFYRSNDEFDRDRFLGKTADGDQRITYVRTGDLGFLHTVTRPIGPGGGMVEMQILFVLGGIGETFEVNGLSHFPMDIEASIEKCHRNIVPGGSAVFQAGGLVVVLVEVVKKAYLASIVPVVVNAILDDHQLVVDIVAFVGRGDFPRSRLGEKQRGKILTAWVARKMRTIAQFAIRDGEVDSRGFPMRSTSSLGMLSAGGEGTVPRPLFQAATGIPSVPSVGTSTVTATDTTLTPGAATESRASDRTALSASVGPGGPPQLQLHLAELSGAPISPVELPGEFESCPVTNMLYNDVAAGNPFGDGDDSVATTPTQEAGRNGIGSRGGGGEVGKKGKGKEQIRKSRHDYPTEALLQLRFVDEGGRGTDGAGQGGGSGGGQGEGHGMAL